MSGTTPEAENRRVPLPSSGDGISAAGAARVGSALSLTPLRPHGAEDSSDNLNDLPSYSLTASGPFPLRVPPGGSAALHEKRELILLCGGGLARELIGYSEGSLAVEDDYTDAKPIRVIGVLDDGMDEGDDVGGVPVLGKMPDAQRIAQEKPDVRFVLAISAPHTYKYRPQVIQRAGLDRDRYATFLMPGAHLVPSVRIGRGVVLFPGVVIGTNAVIEDHVQIWPNVVVSHDCRLEQYTTLASSASLNGDVRVGRGAYVGSGALVREGLNIGEDALVGMGAVVLRDVDPGTVVVGNPAKYLRDI